MLIILGRGHVGIAQGATPLIILGRGHVGVAEEGATPSPTKFF
jgi:hypothetical protein